MTRKPILYGLGISLLLLGSLGAVVLILLRHERNFYQRLSPPPGPERKQNSQEFQSRFLRVITEIREKEPEWEERFTEQQINSYFAEDFVHTGVAEQLLPKEVSEPRIAIEKDRIRLGFRYGKEAWSTVVSMDMRVWLPDNKTNVIAVELVAVHAGGLPVSAQSLLERAFEVAKQNNIEVTWYRYNGNPVALLRFQADQARPTVQLHRLIVSDGLIVIGGKSPEASPLRAMLLPSASEPVAH